MHADCNYLYKRNKTLLYYATKDNDQEMIKYLKEKNAVMKEVEPKKQIIYQNSFISNQTQENSNFNIFNLLSQIFSEDNNEPLIKILLAYFITLKGIIKIYKILYSKYDELIDLLSEFNKNTTLIQFIKKLDENIEKYQLKDIFVDYQNFKIILEKVLPLFYHKILTNLLKQKDIVLSSQVLTSKNHRYLLKQACFSGSAEIFENLYCEKKIDIFTKDESIKNTYLFLAAFNTDLNFVKFVYKKAKKNSHVESIKIFWFLNLLF